MKKKFVVLVILMHTLFLHVGYSQTTNLQSDTLMLIKQSSFSKVEDYLLQFNEDRVPGIAISIIYKGKVNYEAGYGRGD